MTTYDLVWAEKDPGDGTPPLDRIWPTASGVYIVFWFMFLE